MLSVQLPQVVPGMCRLVKIHASNKCVNPPKCWDHKKRSTAKKESCGSHLGSPRTSPKSTENLKTEIELPLSTCMVSAQFDRKKT
jgi:hypothetical protein